MNITISRVLRANEVLSDFMRQQCALIAEYGGSFAVRDFYDGGWFTEYTINWPLPVTVFEEAK